MKWSFRIARIAGIEVKIHVTFFLLLGVYAFLSFEHGGLLAAWNGTVFICLLFLCVVLHEFGHAFAAKLFGIHTPDITLLPIGGVARLERMPRNPFQELIIALAGPAVNVVIALGLWTVLGPLFGLRDLLQIEQPGGDMLVQLAAVNIVLVLFNMIPAFPMDGGRVLRALLAMRLGHGRATTVAARVGQVIAVGFGVLGFFFLQNPILLLIAVFVFLGAQQELTVARIYTSVSEDAKVSDVMVTQFATLPDDLPFGRARTLVMQGLQPVFPVVDRDLRVVGLLRREEILRAPAESGIETRPLGETVRPAQTIPAESDFPDAIDAMQRNGESVVAVTNASGQIVGLVTLAMLMERSRVARG